MASTPYPLHHQQKNGLLHKLHSRFILQVQLQLQLLLILFLLRQTHTHAFPTHSNTIQSAHPQPHQRFLSSQRYLNVPQEGFTRYLPLGNRFTLNCGIQLDDFNLLDHHWIVNDTQILIDNEHFRVSDSDLTIDSFRHDDQGTYRCVLNFKEGTLLGPPHILHTLAFEIENDRTHTQIEYSGRNIILKCPIYAVPPGTVTWKSLSTASEDSLPRFIVLHSGELVIRNTRSADSGSYGCSVKHKVFPNPLTTQINLSILTGPDNTPATVLPTFPKFVRLRDESASYYCLANKATATSSWNRSDIPTDEHGNSVTPPRVHFGKVLSLSKFNGTSEYTCNVAGDSGVTSKRLIASVPPRFPNLPELKHPSARTVRFVCESPEPVKWFKDGVQLIPNTGRIKQHESRPHDLVITNTLQEDSGFYQCESGTRIGTGYLIIEPRKNQPVAPFQLHCTTQSSKSILVQFEDPNSQNKIQAYSIHYATDGGKQNTQVANNTTVLLTNLLPNKNYSIYVRAYTTNGASENSDTIICPTFEDYPTASPPVRSNNRRKVGSTQISLRWEPLSAAMARGIIQEYKLQWKKERNSTFTNVMYFEGDVNEAEINGLEPCTPYFFRVSPANSLGFSPLEDSFQWTSLETSCTNTIIAPPLALELQNVFNSSFSLKWNRLSPTSIEPEYNDSILGYKVFLAHEVPGLAGVYIHMSPIFINDPASTSYTITNLVPMTRYQVRISYFGEDWESDLSTKIVIETSGASSQEALFPVTNIRAKSAPSSVYLEWTPPSSPKIPDYYLVKYNLAGSEESILQKSEDVHLTIQNLQPFQKYEFTVGYSLNGKTIFSELIEVKLEGASNTPIRLDYEVLSNTSVRIKWAPPILSNGPIKTYRVNLANDSQFSSSDWIPANETSLVLLIPYGQITWVRVSAETELGDVGPYSDAMPIIIHKNSTNTDEDTSTTGTSPPGTGSLEDSSQRQRNLGLILGSLLGLISIILCATIIACRNRCFTFIVTHCGRRSPQETQVQSGKDTVDSGPGVEMKILTSQEILDTKGGHPNGAVVSLSNCDGLGVNDPLLIRPTQADHIE